MAIDNEELQLPNWDMTVVFPGLDSKAFNDEFTRLTSEVPRLEKLFDDHGIRRTDSSEITDERIAAFDEVVQRMNTFSRDFETLEAYVYSFLATDSRNDLAQAKVSELIVASVPLSKLSTRLTAWIGSLDIDKLIELSTVAKEHEFFIRRAKKSAEHQMSEIEEDLASSLSPSGDTAWSMLHGNVNSRLIVAVDMPDGTVKKVPMSSVRGMSHDPDAKVREAAYRAEIATWETVSVPLAAALNGIKGWANTIHHRRGWKNSLEPALFNNNTDMETLEAMQAACVESFPDFRRYMKAKAKLLGNQTLPWWDMFAPVGEGASRRWSYKDASDFVYEQFATFSDRMASMAKRAFDENWVDAGPREGKRDGAFCMPLRREESRVMMNFEPSFKSLQTLAHELGHAYHNVNLAERTDLQRSTPMSLAETASTFCQTIVFNAALDEAGDGDRLALLEEALQDSCQIVVDIHSRFLFEKSVFEAREQRELSVDEFNNLMLDAQRQTYGDGLDTEALHPYMWAVKGHYYGPLYYNWPYTYGMLFAFGLFSRYRQDAESFKKGYDDMLSSTGMSSAFDLAKRFDIDIHSVDFWRSSLDICRERVDEFVKVVG
ncbi:MAG: M3 family oligoendopeptidase [Actinomycetota bacterium]|nr:M3 family oligoendopeptidase [Actinomycetota bacterium]